MHDQHFTTHTRRSIRWRRRCRRRRGRLWQQQCWKIEIFHLCAPLSHNRIAKHSHKTPFVLSRSFVLFARSFSFSLSIAKSKKQNKKKKNNIQSHRSTRKLLEISMFGKCNCAYTSHRLLTLLTSTVGCWFRVVVVVVFVVALLCTVLSMILLCFIWTVDVTT